MGVRLPAQRLGRELAQRHEHARPERRELSLQERLAGRHLVGLGVAVVGGTALDDVADVHVGSLEPHGGDHPGEQLPGRPHERLALLVLVGAGRLAHEHQVRLGVAHPEDDLLAPARQLAARALAQLLPHHPQRLGSAPPRRRRAPDGGRRRCWRGRAGAGAGQRAGAASRRGTPRAPERARASRWVRNPAISVARSLGELGSGVDRRSTASRLDQRVERDRVIERRPRLVVEAGLPAEGSGHACPPGRRACS